MCDLKTNTQYPNIEKAIKLLTLEIIRVRALHQGADDDYHDPDIETLRKVRNTLEDHLGGF